MPDTGVTVPEPSTDPSTPAAHGPAHAAAGKPLRSAILLGALGVVFGDIGTSPIYALRESLKAGGGQPDVAAVFGVLSLVFWAVVIVVAIKYVMLVMRADNDGEGGTMALLSLALPVCGRARTAMLVIGLAGASLFFGDAMITPAISVLSAIEGLALVTPRVTPYVVPIAVVVLIALFSIQRRGSGVVGKLFGPVMVAWFAMLAVAGIVHIFDQPAVLAALDPRYAIHYLTHANGWGGLIVIGSVFLALTGGEALYADMGHFGRRAIRIDWFVIVMPALVLNYLGQGALVLVDGHAVDNPFFHMFGGRTLLPAVLLATMATIIASQAVISGAFALVQQAIQLGALPRLHVLQTSDEAEGQVYVSPVNWLLAVAVIGLVVGFRSSDALASAYGMAVSGNMLVTTLLVAIVAHRLWQWSLLIVLPVMGSFVLLDLTFVSANVHKIPSGGWFPLTVGAVLLTMMLCWRHGRTVALEKRGERAIALEEFLALLDSDQAPTRVPGTAIYLTQSHDYVPEALALNLRHNSVVHECVVLLKVTTERVPRMHENARVKVVPLAAGFRGVEMTFGFAEKPDVPAAFAAHSDGLGFDPASSTYFLGRETPVPSLHPEIPRWQEHVYAFLTHNAVRAPDYYRIPPDQVVELGTRVEM